MGRVPPAHCFLKVIGRACVSQGGDPGWRGHSGHSGPRPRLVASGTVEDKTVALHQRKRELADALLEGADGGTRMDAAELLRLMREP